MFLLFEWGLGRGYYGDNAGILTLNVGRSQREEWNGVTIKFEGRGECNLGQWIRRIVFNNSVRKLGLKL